MSFDLAQKIRESTKSYTEISKEFGIGYGRVGKIKRGETWKAWNARDNGTCYIVDKPH